MPTEAQLTNLANDLAAVGQKWATASAATAIVDKPGLIIYPPADGPTGYNYPAAGRLWTSPTPVYSSVVNSQWPVHLGYKTDIDYNVYDTFWWNFRLDQPHYNGDSDSGTATPQALDVFYTRQPIGIRGQTTQVSKPLIFNIFDKQGSGGGPVRSFPVCSTVTSPRVV